MDLAAIEDMFASLGPVSVRRMFGGKGVYHRGIIVAVEIGGEMRLKADTVSAPAFEAAGAQRWQYEKPGGKAVTLPYWSVPAEAYDDPDEMARWVRLAWDAALRSTA